MSFTTIPYEDINTLLSSNNIIIPDTKEEAYELAYNILASDEELQFIPDSILDWITAYNVGEAGIPIADYTTSQIITASDTDLEQITTTFNLATPDRERIIRILNYLQALTDDLISLEVLPEDALDLILKELDCKTMLLMCKLSTKINKYCKSTRFHQLLRNKLGVPQASFDELSSICLKTTRNVRHNVFAQVYYRGEDRHYVLGFDNTIYKIERDGSHNPISVLSGNVLEFQNIRHENKTSYSLEGGLIAVTKDGNIYEIELGQYNMEKIGSVKNAMFTITHEYLFVVVTANNQIFLYKVPLSVTDYYGKFEETVTETKPLRFANVGNIVDLEISEDQLLILNSDGKVWSLS